MYCLWVRLLLSPLKNLTLANCLLGAANILDNSLIKLGVYLVVLVSDGAGSWSLVITVLGML